MIEVKNISKAFDNNVVLDNVSLTVKDQENVVIFGRSGTGKSVLLKIIVRLLDPDSGEVIMDGENILNYNSKKINELRKNLGFLFQGAALYDSMSVRENLEFPLIRNFNFSPEEREKKVKDVLRKVSLEKAIDKMPAELSGGMKKRIGLARTIITEPKLILYDEPTTGLDPITTKEISHLINDLQSEINATSIIVTHDLICAQIIANHAVVLKDAKIRYEGDLQNLTSTDDEFLKNFFSNEIVEANNRSDNGK